MTTKAPFTGCLLAALVVFTSAGRGQIPAAVRTPTPGLSDFIATATRDTNGDGIADSVAARVIVPARPRLKTAPRRSTSPPGWGSRRRR